MQRQKLTGEQKAILRWRGKRNRLVDKILSKDQFISREDAMRQANEKCGPMPGRRS
jgi:hypothetical protein